MTDPFEPPTGNALRLRVRVTPKASADRIAGIVMDETGVGWLQLTVTAVPEGGRANKAVTSLLAKRFRLAKSRLSVVRGQSERRKVIEIEDADPAGLRARLMALIDGGSTGL